MISIWRMRFMTSKSFKFIIDAQTHNIRYPTTNPSTNPSKNPKSNSKHPFLHSRVLNGWSRLIQPPSLSISRRSKIYTRLLWYPIEVCLIKKQNTFYYMTSRKSTFLKAMNFYRNLRNDPTGDAWNHTGHWTTSNLLNSLFGRKVFYSGSLWLNQKLNGWCW